MDDIWLYVTACIVMFAVGYTGGAWQRASRQLFESAVN